MYMIRPDKATYLGNRNTERNAYHSSERKFCKQQDKTIQEKGRIIAFLYRFQNLSLTTQIVSIHFKTNRYFTIYKTY